MDRFSKEVRSRIMSRIRSESSIEKLPKSFKGMYMRKHVNIVGRPDFASKKRKIALFIDGCFWHGCPAHYRAPKSNLDYWIPKIMYNVLHDCMVNDKLTREGYDVVRIWECEL